MENAVGRELILSCSKKLLFQEIESDAVKVSNALLSNAQPDEAPEPGLSMSLDKTMAKHIQQVLAIAKGKVEGQMELPNGKK